MDEANNLITANQARAITHHANMKLSPKLLEVVNGFITNTAKSGGSECSLNSLDDHGNIVRGIGCYLSENVRAKLKTLLENKGYTVSVEKNQIEEFKIRW